MKRFLITIAIMLAICCVGFAITTSSPAYADAPTYNNSVRIARYNNKTFVLDKGTGTLGHKLYIQGSSMTTIGGYGYENNQLVSPTLFCMNETNIYIYTANNDGATNYIIKSFDYEGNYVASYNTYLDANNTTKPIGTNLIDFACDVFGNAYFLDLSHSTILQKPYIGEDRLVEYQVEGIEIHADTRLINDIMGNIYIINTDSIVKVNTKTKASTTYEVDSIDTTNVDIDCNGRLYTFTSQAGMIAIHSITLSSTVTTNDYTVECEDTPTSYAIDKATGALYYMAGVTKSILPKHNNEQIISTISNFSTPTGHITTAPLTESITIAQPRVSTVGYHYPYFINPIISLATTDYVYVIGQEGIFSVCLVTNKSSSNILAYIYSAYLQTISLSATTDTKVISVPSTIAYRFPSSLSASSSISNPIKTDLTLTYNTQVTITRKFDNYPDYNNMKFVEIKVDNKYYYVNVGALSDKIDAQTSGIKTNAEVSIKDDSESISVYLLVNDEYVDSGLKLINGTKIRLNDFDKTKSHNSITYTTTDGSVIDGYILTKYIRKDGVSIEIIIAIVLIAICGVLAIIFLTTSKKNR